MYKCTALKRKALLVSACIAVMSFDAFAEEQEKKRFADRWDITAYIELAAQRNWDRLGSRRSNPLGGYPAWTVNLPKSSIWAQFDCGKGWSVGTQVEFTNGGTVPMRGIGNADDRPMDWDRDLSLSEMWVQKSFSDAANIKVGLIGTPVGRQNDLPTQFFGVVRPEDGPGYLQLNNQSPAIDFNGESGAWAYDVMFMPGFVNYDYGNDGWRLGTGEDTYTQTIDRLYAGAFRVDNSSVDGLTVGLSGEVGAGHTLHEYGEDEESVTRRIRSVLTLASLDWEYDKDAILFRGAYQFGYIANRDRNTAMNDTYGPVRDMSAMSLGAEAGYDFFTLSRKLSGKQKFYVFARYDWCQRRDFDPGTAGRSFSRDGQRCSFGLNWMPMEQIIVKAEWGFGFDADPTRTFAGVSVAWQPKFP